MYYLLLLVLAFGYSQGVTIISRDGWGARPPTSVSPMSNPVPYVVIHHSANPPVCLSQSACISAMQGMQNYHMDTNGWADIGYSFTVGGDGNAYEGRGWSAVGAHAPGYNSNSIGICVIGNWMTSLPAANQMQAIHELIQTGVDMGMIRSDYMLLGHRQVRETECPGDSLFNEITTWPHWTEVLLT